MRLKTLAIRKLYGSIDKDVRFNEDVNLLVGINGSGKTSVLNLIQWMLNASIAPLCTTQFESVAIWFEHDGIHWSMEATQDDIKLDIYLRSPGVELGPFNVKLIKPARLIQTEDDAEVLRQRYSTYAPDERELPFAEAVSKFPKPIAIALDRTLFAEGEDFVFVDSVEARRRKPPKVVQSAVAKVGEVASENYLRYTSRVFYLNEELKAKLVMSAFRVPQTTITNRPGGHGRTLRDIDELERRAIHYLSGSIQAPDVTEQIRTYFRTIKELRNAPSSKREMALMTRYFSNQYQQLSDFADAFTEFEKRSSAAYEPMRVYLDSINLFFSDSRKHISFDAPSNRLVFRFLDGDGRPHGDQRGIDHLSSGERQILILFTFLALIAKEHRVFIVDEPELSLHPKWQSEFLSAFLRLKPDNTQLLLATHSPDIVGARKNDCIVLLP